MQALANIDTIGRQDPEVSSAADRLQEQGYLILPKLADDAIFSNVAEQLSPHFEGANFGSGPFYGETTRRFGRVLSRSRDAEYLALHPLIMGVVETVIGRHCQSIQLNLTQAQVEQCRRNTQGTRAGKYLILLGVGLGAKPDVLTTFCL